MGFFSYLFVIFIFIQRSADGMAPTRSHCSFCSHFRKFQFFSFSLFFAVLNNHLFFIVLKQIIIQYIHHCMHIVLIYTL